jgi:hypothetical protein
MLKWEYCFVQSSVGFGGGVYFISPKGERKKLSGADSEGTYIIQLLTHYGASGWEVCGVGNTGTNAGIYTTTWTLKRFIPTEVQD